jgi:anti-sigma B factor antagonist
MFDIQHVKDAVLVKLVGDIGQPEADELDRAMGTLLPGKPALVVFDLQQVTIIASAAVACLLALNRTLRWHGGKVRLAAPSRNVMAALHFTRIDDILEICGSAQTALNG